MFAFALLHFHICLHHHFFPLLWNESVECRERLPWPKKKILQKNMFSSSNYSPSESFLMLNASFTVDPCISHLSRSRCQKDPVVCLSEQSTLTAPEPVLDVLCSVIYFPHLLDIHIHVQLTLLLKIKVFWKRFYKVIEMTQWPIVQYPPLHSPLDRMLFQFNISNSLH